MTIEVKMMKCFKIKKWSPNFYFGVNKTHNEL